MGSRERARGGSPGPGYAVPELPARYVRRPELEERLESGVAAGHVLVAAPAGAGKTLLLASWAAHRRTPTAWLTLDPEDGEPHRLWGRVLTAIQSAADFPPDAVLASMHPPPVHDQRFVRLLVQGCEDPAAPCVVVLDDVHLLIGTPAMNSLGAAVHSGLGRLRLVLSTRSDPPIPLQRLRLEGRLTELRAADLSFRPPDAVRLLAGHDVVASPEQVATLVEKTEGWAAGLRLAALSLQGSTDVAATIGELAGEQRTVADYFTEEVLATQDPATTRFLLDTCVVGQVSGDLADALTGRRDGRETLARLERENLFVIALDGRREWYRYHALFGDLLRHRLRSLDPAHADELHRRASAWFAQHGDPLEAARHLSAASDWLGLSRLILRGAGTTLLGVQRSALASVLEDLPPIEAERHAEVAAAAAVAAYARYDSAAVTGHLRRSRALLDQLPERDALVTDAVLTTLEAIVAWIDADAAREVTAAREASRLLAALDPVDVPTLPVYQVGVAAIEGMGLLWSGELATAERIFATMLELFAKSEGASPVLGLHLRGSRAVLKAISGRLCEARVQIEAALRVAEDSGWSFLPLSATTYLAHALVRLLEADLDGCAEAIARGSACIGDRRDRHAEAALGLVEVRLLVDRRQPESARRRFQRLDQELEGWQRPPFLQHWSGIVAAEVALAAGDGDRALAILSAMAPSTTDRPYAQHTITLARVHLACHRPQECLATLEPLLSDPPQDHGPAADAWLLAAVAHDRLRQDARAQAALDRSVAVAAPEGIVRPYVVNGDRALPLLRTHRLTTDAHRSFVEGLIARLTGERPAQAAVAPLTEPLTNREQSVLLLLPTMMTNSEIAEQLHVSVNTVKVHLKGLHRKLGVSTRREAVARARALGLVRDVASGTSSDPG